MSTGACPHVLKTLAVNKPVAPGSGPRTGGMAILAMRANRECR